jgi:hypothetical protein
MSAGSGDRDLNPEFAGKSMLPRGLRRGYNAGGRRSMTSRFNRNNTD